MEALQTEGPTAADPPAALVPTPSATLEATAVDVAPTPSVVGSLAPDPATVEPTLLPSATVMPEPSATLEPTAQLASSATPQSSGAPPYVLPPLTIPTTPPLSHEERWRRQQLDRQPFAAPQAFVTAGSELWWFDPVNQQAVILGQMASPFLAQAEFTLRSQGVSALEVPYQINQSYGLTALSPALLERMRLAGFTDWVETYVFLTPQVRRR